MAIFEAESTVNCSLETLWDFLIRPANVAATTPPDMKLIIVQGPEVVELGSRLLLEIQAFGQSQRTMHEIVEFDPHRQFSEQQIKGPLRAWVHDHIVEELSDGACRLVDRIRFEPPGGLVGLLMNESRLKGLLQKSFAHRYGEIKRRLES